MASSKRSMSTTMMTGRDKVRSIFDRFDANRDGGLSRDEMGALVTTVNPNVKLSSDQVSAILDEVFRSYSDFIENPLTGLSFKGLLRIYDEGAGDVDRDYSALFHSSLVISTTQLNEAPSNSHSYSMIVLADKSTTTGTTQRIATLRVAAAWAKSPNHGVEYDDTWKLVEDLEIVIRRRIEDCTCGHKKDFRVERDHKRFVWDENCGDFRTLLKEVREIRVSIDRNLSREEAFDGHMAIGQTLLYYNLLTDALQSFQRAVDLSPIDVRAQFEIGYCLYLLGRSKEAKLSYMLGLELAAETNSNRWWGLLPKLHIQLGIVLKREGMLLCACEHYREALVLCPTNDRAFRLLGTALLQLGEYRAAEKALEEAVLLKPEFADAHYYLGSVLHEMGEDERAILEFQRAIDLNPNHLDALYELGCLFQDMGRYHRAAEIYERVMGIQPNYWRAQVNRLALMWRTGKDVDVVNVYKEGLSKMTDFAELPQLTAHIMAQLEKKNQGGHDLSAWAKIKKGLADGVHVIKRVTEKTKRDCPGFALHIWDFQRITTFHLCDVSLLNKEIEEWKPPVSYSESEEPKRPLISKATLELILRKLLHYLTPEDFRVTVVKVNQKILRVLDATGSGRIDLGMFYAVIAPICAGEPGNRKRAAFDALLWRGTRRNDGQDVIQKVDALIYMRYLRLIYLSSPQGYRDQLVVHVEEDENTMVSFPEFLQIFDDHRRGFGIFSTLVNLEIHGRFRRDEHSCDVCRYPMLRRRFKIRIYLFSLCMK
ncbi:uncharacterized TPR repeat-containing protein At2g32450-like [Macadamia integrifolia]|uniref:uncharacterized TPR repeat-containing protein At2g32450-like n=1 Tax=Macadamia integrifolia TaxID=60698 RepID=UPI001C4FA5E9|nr:uncharacterized TPR repeat-containing protein At2g32450-like [Macadamia integrifolia]